MKQIFSLAFSSVRALCLSLALGLSLTAATTTITDTLLLPNGNPAAGVDFTITQTAFFSGSTYYPAWALQPHPVTDSSGNFSFALQPNPTGQLYTVTLTQPNGVKTSTCWNVPVSGSPVNVKTVLSTTCGTPPLSLINAGQISNLGSVGTGIYGAMMPNLKFPAANSTNLASGDNDLYTVPAGRKALIPYCRLTNSTSGQLIYVLEAKIAGIYYKYGAVVAPTSLTNDSALTSGSPPILFNAGESLSVNLSAPGGTIWCGVYEFDAISPLSVARLTSFSAGNNTLITVSGNGIAALPVLTAPVASIVNQPSIGYANNSGTTRIVQIYLVPNAGSPSAANQLTASAGLSVSNTSSTTAATYPGSQAVGDSIIVNVDAATATQFAWMVYIQM